jgi:hypothetical protein
MKKLIKQKTAFLVEVFIYISYRLFKKQDKCR